jgi:hypothetical protein
MEKTIGHGRLLYTKCNSNNLESWLDELAKIDSYIEQGQKLSIAEDSCYLYFFSFDDKDETYWCGRDVIGFESFLPDEFAFFDYYSGSVVEKELKSTFNSKEELFEMANKMKSNSTESKNIAMTWRVKMIGVDHGLKTDKNSLIEMPKMAFQFFKSH